MSLAVGVMARAPSSGGKSRLAPHLSPSRLTALRAALLDDTLTALKELPEVTIFFTPDDAEPEMAGIAGRTRGSAGTVTVRQSGGDLGERMLNALRCLLDSRCDGAVLVGSDIPMLTADHVAEAEALLDIPGSVTALAERRVVLGPADDGGYYLIGMREAHAGLFEGIEWGTESVLTDTLRAAERAGVEARLVRSAYDVDTIDDLRRLERDLAAAHAASCPALRRWFTES